MAKDEPHASVGGLLGLGKDSQNSVRIMPKYEKSQVTRSKSSCDRSMHERKEDKVEEVVREEDAAEEEYKQEKKKR